jgi:hypothetical protein
VRQPERDSLTVNPWREEKGEAMRRKSNNGFQGQILAVNGEAEVMVSFLRFDSQRKLIDALGSVQEFLKLGCKYKFISERVTGPFVVEWIPTFDDIDLNALG